MSIIANRDQTPIFGAEAPGFYARGIPVIPLHYHDKRPIPNAWQRFAQEPVPESLQAQWIEDHHNCNIGVVLGEQSGLTVVDIDSSSDAVIEVIQQVLLTATGGLHSPWRRVGRKGMVLAYRFTGLPTFRIKDVTGATLVEVLSSNTQVVLPPSIHPETKSPYKENVHLLEVIDDLPELNNQVEGMLRGALKDQGIELSQSGSTKVTDWTPTGARDVQMTSVAGHYAYGVLRGELPLKEAIDRMKAWHASCVEQVAGDDVDINKGIKNLVAFVYRDVVEKGRILPKGWDETLTEADKTSMGLNFDADQEEWDVQELKDYLHNQFEMHEPDSQPRWTAIDKTLKKMAQSTKLNSLEEERILTYIRDAGGTRLNMAALRKRLRDVSSGEMKGRDHTEIARAVMKDMEQYGPLHYHGDQFWTWLGSHWGQHFLDKDGVQKDIRSEILRHTADQYGHLDAARRYSDHQGILKTIASLVPQGICGLAIKGVNFANGVLMLNGELKPHDKEYGFTYTLPFRYIPEAASEARQFQDFIARCWGADDDFEQKQKALQEALCMTIFGMGPSFQKAVLLHGAPKSGKSTLLTIVSSLMPDDAKSSCPPDQWGDKFQPATMLGKLINVCGELADRHKIDGKAFKQIVDGEETQAQLKGHQIFRFKPICTHWFASNHLPKTDDTSSAFNRRWLILDFRHPINNGERVLNFGEKVVAEEREAIAAWAVAALPELLERCAIQEPDSHEELIQEVASQNNSVRFFLRESGLVRVEPALGKTSPSTCETTLHSVYWSWCFGEGAAKPVPPKDFRAKMRELQAEIGFKMEMVQKEDQDVREATYFGLTLAPNAKAA
mgnify:CR=1 FL=1